MGMIRLFDILLSFLAMIILLPFMLPIIITLKLTGEHYVFYLQPRVGLGGRDFNVFKFATMLKDSPNLPGGVLTQKDDPRILPLGKFLRKTKINELPQLINIFIGQMSFVGPRPQARKHYELYSSQVKMEINKIRPGLTGIGSIVFRDEEKLLDNIKEDRDHFHDTIITPYKGLLETWYVKNRNLRLYFLCILLTALVVVLPGNRMYKKLIRNLPEPPKELQSLL